MDTTVVVTRWSSFVLYLLEHARCLTQRSTRRAMFVRVLRLAAGCRRRAYHFFEFSVNFRISFLFYVFLLLLWFSASRTTHKQRSAWSSSLHYLQFYIISSHIFLFLIHITMAHWFARPSSSSSRATEWISMFFFFIFKWPLQSYYRIIYLYFYSSFIQIFPSFLVSLTPSDRFGWQWIVIRARLSMIFFIVLFFVVVVVVARWSYSNLEPFALTHTQRNSDSVFVILLTVCLLNKDFIFIWQHLFFIS